MSNEALEPIKILLVEDNPGDVRLVKESLRDDRIANELSVVNNGVDAIDFLKRTGRYANSPRPDLILLDLNLPKKDGREVLEDIKRDPNLKTIPVVVLTSSKADEDIARTYNLHANCYVTKPVVLEQFLKVVQEIEEFWVAIVKLPGRGGGH